MRAMWIGTETASRLGLGNEFFDRLPTHITPPGATFLRNAEHLYGLWFFAINTSIEWQQREQALTVGEPDENGLRTFQGRAARGALQTTHRWLAAILATLIEAYTKDVLALVASLDATVMNDTPPSPPQPAVAPTISTGPNIAAAEVRTWAHAWFRSRRRPREWIRGLEDLGVTGFAIDLEERLYELLGVRHLVVHSAGVVDEDYLRHHPTSPWALGTDAPINQSMVHAFCQTTFEFFAPVEAHFFNRYLRGKL